MDRSRVRIPDIWRKKDRREPITALTAYDYPLALACDRAGIDIILVGDSYGMVALGYESTVPVTMDEMITACKAVARGARAALLVGDMPFMSYQADVAEAVRNAGRFLKEGGMDGVKLEGGSDAVPAVRAITGAGIAVMGHLGLTPQSISKLGGYRTQGTTAQAARKLLDDALALQDAGCFSLVLEKVPARVADVISRRLSIPTIGIGAGAGCDGQVLVIHDLLGLFDRFTPPFVRRYAELHRGIASAISAYKTDVETRAFPAPEHCYTMAEEEWEEFKGALDEP
jgi:3-methyl-2-oxobutanoate hydroxymethyltransferase